MSHRIKKALDKIAGKEKIFTHEDKKAIYARVQKEGDQQMKNRRKNKWGIGLTYGLTAALLFVLAWAGIQHNLPSEKASSVNKTHKVHKTSSTKKKKSQTQHHASTLGSKKQGATIQQLLKQKPKLDTKGAKQNPKKFQIVKMMYNSWNHVHNIQGQFEIGYPQMNAKGETTFYLDLDHQKNFVNQQFKKKGKLSYLEKVLYQKHKITLERPKQKVYTDWPIQKSQSGNFNVYQALNFSDGNLMNSLWYGKLENNYQNWNYTEGTKLGMSVYVIQGTQKGVPFKMTIAKNTGVLLSFKQYDYKNHKVLSGYMTVKQIKINKGIPASQFQLNVSGDKKDSFYDYSTKLGSGGLLDRGKICASNCK